MTVAEHARVRPRRPRFGRFGELREVAGRVICHICGLGFRSLGKHAGKAHGTKSPAYREAFGLMKGRPLTCSATSGLHREQSLAGLTPGRRLAGNVEGQRHRSGPARLEAHEAISRSNRRRAYVAPPKAIEAELPEVDGRLICAVCGRAFRWLDGHFRAAHGLSAIEYRERFGLGPGDHLASTAARRDRAKKQRARLELLLAGEGA